MLRLLAAALLSMAFLIGVPQTAFAQDGDGSSVDYENGGGQDQDDSGGAGNDSGSGAGNGNSPPCTFQGSYNEICVGNSACWVNDPARVESPQELEGVEPPNPDDHIVFISCITPSGDEWDRWYWSSQWENESVLDRMWTARGRVSIPGFSPEFNPPTRSIVNVPTWFAAPGTPTNEVVGSSAAGLVAIASPSGMSVDPGDGSADLACSVATVPSEACTHTYRRNHRSGYTARVTVSYDLRYEMNGQVIEIPAGAPADLVQLQVGGSVTVPVLEVQSIVTDL